MVPSAGNRRAPLERGGAELSFELAPRDFAEMKQQAKLKIISTPISNGFTYIGMNVTKPPFDNLKVRQAIAYAIPYMIAAETPPLSPATLLLSGNGSSMPPIHALANPCRRPYRLFGNTSITAMQPLNDHAVVRSGRLRVTPPPSHVCRPEAALYVADFDRKNPQNYWPSSHSRNINLAVT